MRKHILIAIALGLVAAGVKAALTITLASAATYTDPQWKAVCISNKVQGVYTANIELCPSDEAQGITGRCQSVQWQGATLPAPAVTIVNYMIGVWNAEHPAYSP